MSNYVVGLNCSSHDRSAALMRDGLLVGAIAEERLDRRKRSQGFYHHAARGLVVPPMRALTYVLRQAGIGLEEVDLIVVGRSITSCKEAVIASLPVDPARIVEPPLPSHHLAHAYSAYLTSPFQDMDVLVIDEQGHWLDNRFERCSWFAGNNAALTRGPQFRGNASDLSIGMFFDVFAALCGLSEASLPAAGKLMALAGSGRPPRSWPSVVKLLDSGDVSIPLAALDALLSGYSGLLTAPGYTGFEVSSIEDLRVKYVPLRWQTTDAATLARYAQDQLEASVLHIASTRQQQTRRSHLAYAGGVALNCTANARLLETGYQDVFVHPAATDDGSAIGLAAY